MPPRDSQRARVYAWENREIAPHDTTKIPFATAQAMVRAIWAEMGLSYPPEVASLPRQSRAVVADATRLRIRLPDSTLSWYVLHELAHAMTSTHEGKSDGHGPIFMGVYVQLLTRYLRLPLETLLRSLSQDGISVDLAAKPVFLDGRH
jgi:hypothetical protein